MLKLISYIDETDVPLNEDDDKKSVKFGIEEENVVKETVNMNLNENKTNNDEEVERITTSTTRANFNFIQSIVFFSLKIYSKYIFKNKLNISYQ